MARITRPLTNNEILKAKPREKDFPLHDGDGLFLLVKTSGKKLWRFRYQRPVRGSRTDLSLGSYPALTLAAARQFRDQYLVTLAQGMDPQHRNNPKQAMNSQTANAALKRAGWNGKLVAHGLRSIASTTLNEKGFNPDVIEAALAHTDKNEVRRAYNRSVYLQQRVELMQWWGNFVDNKRN